MKLLSICIPCYKRVDLVRQTLDSIFVDNSDADSSEFEIIISENDPDKEICGLIKEYNYPNLKYVYSECEGFMNSYNSLIPATGEFLKLHNSQSKFLKGSISYLISLIKKSRNGDIYIFFSNAEINGTRYNEFDNFNDFLYSLSYWPSWSNGFGIWIDDFKKLKDSNIRLNRLFPHTSLFVTQTMHKKFMIDNTRLFEVQRVGKRGGHNKFEAFTIEFPSIISESLTKGDIAPKTYEHILRDIMTKFLPSLLFNKYIARIETFEINGYRVNIKKFFPKYAFWVSWLLVPFVPFSYLWKSMRIKFNRNETLL